MTKTDLPLSYRAAIALVKRGELNPSKFVVAVAPPVPLSFNKTQEAWAAAGLTRAGKPRKLKKHPELAGLPHAEYVRRYREKMRQVNLSQAGATPDRPNTRPVSNT